MKRKRLLLVHYTCQFLNWKHGMPQNPPAEISLKTYNVKMEDNSVYIFI